jgi:hypothetical protein
MRIRLLIGAVLGVAFIALGALVGSVVGTRSIAAQTSTTPQTQASPTPGAPNNPSNGNPLPSAPWMGRGFDKGMGMRGPDEFGAFGGPGGFAGPGMRGHGPGGPRGGAGLTADSVSREISNTANLIKLVRDDLAYANGKMDTANLTKWVNGADTLLNNARTAASASQLEKAAGYAHAAAGLAMAADGQMAYTLGADKLPSYNQRPMHRMPNPANQTAPTQAQASRVLARTYEELVMKAALVKGNSEASGYLTDAQNAYKDAYSAYQAGKYADALSKARLAGELSGVAAQIVHAASAPNSPDTPVTVPAPNF